MTRVLLAAEGVAHTFGRARPVLDGVDLTLRAGERLVVLGPNGAGKTTLLRVLAGLLSPASGRATVAGDPLRGLPRREVARRIAVVPQELAVPFPYSVREMVAMGRAPRLGALGRELAADRAAVDAAMTRLGLSGLALRAFPTLSGGEKQRVILARALAQQADVLLLDEPTAHMDLGHRVHTFDWLAEWVAERRDARGALVVTHDLWLGARFADRMILLDRGRCVADGAPAEVLTPERISAVYGVDVDVQADAAGRPLLVAARSRIGYIGPPDER